MLIRTEMEVPERPDFTSWWYVMPPDDSFYPPSIAPRFSAGVDAVIAPRMDESRSKRITENERILHEANERIERLAAEAAGGGWPGGSEDADFFCACGRPHCTETVRLSLREYEAVHRYRHRYVVVKGHENPQIERVVEDLDTYNVVEKLRHLW